MNIVYNSKDNDECTTNSNYGYKHNNYTGRRKKSNFNINLNLKHSLVLFFTFFSIVLPVGILQGISNYAFAQTDINSIDDSIDENGNVISSTASKIKEQDRIHSSPDNDYSIQNIITLEDISNLKSSSGSSSSQSVQAQSANEVYGDFNGDGRDDLAIGVPFEDVDTGAGTITDAGAINVLYSSSNGLSATTPRPDQFWTQSTSDVNDVAEPGDRFGFALA